MKVIFSPRRERILTVFKASISVIVKFVCVCVCVPTDRSMWQTLSLFVCECVFGVLGHRWKAERES